MRIPAEIRWLGGAKVRTRFQANKDGSSFVVAAAPGEATFGRLCRAGVRLLRRRYEVNAFEEAGRPDALCSQCSGWKHIAPHCSAAAPRCALCAKDHLTADHRRPVEGRKMGKGHPCPHGAKRCANCGEAHGAQANACAVKREARLSARGWSPAPPRRERRMRWAVESPDVESPETKTPIAQGGRVRARRSRRGRREGRPRLPWRWGSRWLGVLSFLFFLVRPGAYFSFLYPAGLGGRRLGSPGLSHEMGTRFGLWA